MQYILSPPHHQRTIRKKPIHSNNTNKNPHPLTRPARSIAIFLQYARPADLTLGGQVRLIHALAGFAARVGPMLEFVDHHALEDVCLSSAY